MTPRWLCTHLLDLLPPRRAYFTYLHVLARFLKICISHIPFTGINRSSLQLSVNGVVLSSAASSGSVGYVLRTRIQVWHWMPSGITLICIFRGSPEYDNDPDDPRAPQRSAYDSAIFARLRNANGNIHATKEAGRSTDYLGIALPSDTGAPTEVDKDLTRRSKASIDMLHNPFGGDEEEEPEEDLEVDLASWGLDSLIPDKKSGQSSRATKGKAKSDVLPNTRQVSTVGIGPRPGASQPAHSRSMSTPLAEFGEGGCLPGLKARG